jgi:hypothetical protein
MGGTGWHTTVSLCCIHPFLTMFAFTLALGPTSCYDTYEELSLHLEPSPHSDPRVGGHVGKAVIQLGAELPGPG